MTGDGVQGFSGAGPETGESSDEEGHAEVLEKVFSPFVLVAEFGIDRQPLEIGVTTSRVGAVI